MIVEESFYDNGNIEFSVEKINGLKHGVAKYWDESGYLINEVSYMDDKINGIWISYYPSGEIKYRSNYVNNKRHGIMLEYYSNGNKKRISTYEYDIEVSSISFDLNGKKIKN